MRVGLIALLVVGCSSSSSSGPKLADDDKAGVVLSVTGEVTATLAGDSRVLAVDGPVFAGDTVVTPADGAVAIELAHNGAVLSLGGDKRVVLRQHAAWRVEPKKGGALDRASDDQTAVAGRHAERSSADTRSTAVETPSEDPKADEEPAEDKPGSQYRITAEEQARVAAERERLAKEAARQQAAEAEMKARQAELEAEMQKARAEAERAAAKRRLEELRKQRDNRRRPPKGDAVDKKKIAVKCDPNDPLCGIEDSGGSAPDRLVRALDGVDVASCKPHGAGKVTLRVSVAADGKLTVEIEKATSDALGNCVAGLVRALELGAGDARTATRTFEIR